MFRQWGITQEAYEKFLKPTLAVGLFAPPGQLRGRPADVMVLWPGKGRLAGCRSSAGPLLQPTRPSAAPACTASALLLLLLAGCLRCLLDG